MGLLREYRRRRAIRKSAFKVAKAYDELERMKRHQGGGMGHLTNYALYEGMGAAADRLGGRVRAFARLTLYKQTVELNDFQTHMVEVAASHLRQELPAILEPAQASSWTLRPFYWTLIPAGLLLEAQLLLTQGMAAFTDPWVATGHLVLGVTAIGRSIRRRALCPPGTEEEMKNRVLDLTVDVLHRSAT